MRKFEHGRQTKRKPARGWFWQAVEQSTNLGVSMPPQFTSFSAPRLPPKQKKRQPPFATQQLPFAALPRSEGQMSIELYGGQAL
jgi:hypothetical protein